MKKTICIILATAFAATLQAAVPLAWNVETTRAQPAAFDCYRGETLTLRASLFNAGTALDVSGAAASLYWQTNGMGEVYWSAPATAASNVLSATWAPTNDVGAASYNCFIGVAGEIYRAAFRIRMLPSPGAVPAELDLPAKSIDFATVTVHNAPYYTKGEADSALSAAATAATNYVNAVAAGKQDTISDLAAIREGAALGATALQSESDPVWTAEKGGYATVSDINRLNQSKLEVGDFNQAMEAADGRFTRATNEIESVLRSAMQSLNGIDGWLNENASLPQDNRRALAGKQDNLPYPTNAIPYAAITGKPTNVSAFNNDAGYISSYTESDPVWTAEKGGYATTSALAGKADDNAVVHLTGDQQTMSAVLQLMYTLYAESGIESHGDYRQTWGVDNDFAGELVISQDSISVRLADEYEPRYYRLQAGGGGTVALLENIAPAFVYLQSYGVDELCTSFDADPNHKGYWLYKCIVATDGSTPPETDTTHWTPATVEDVLAALRTGKADTSALTAHTGDATIHVTAADKAAWSGKQDTISDLAAIRSGAALGATALQSYTETDPTVPAWAKAASKPAYTYAEITGKPTFATVATSGSYNDLTDKPSIPSPTAPVASATLAWQSNGSAIVVSVGAAETLSSTLTGWVDGQTQTALITIAAGASVAANVKLVGYGTWPTGGQFLASATRVGNFVYVTPIVLVN